MTKNILLAATAASVMAFAGAASAHTLTFRGATAAAVDSTETGGASSPYQLAAEAKAITPAFATFALTDALSSGNLPSGNVILTITVANGTFNTALSAANVTSGAGCTTFTAVPSSGGASGSTTATFVISNSAANCSSFNLDLPITPGATGAVTVTTRLVTDGSPGTIIDGGDSNVFTILSRPSAFGATIDAAIGAGALDDTFATLLQTPVYTQFRTGASTGGHDNLAPTVESTVLGQLGTVRINLTSGLVYRDLAFNLIAAADVQSANLVVNGSFTAFDGTGGDVTLGTASAKTAPSTLTSSVATFTGTQFGGGGANDLTSAARPFQVVRETADVSIPSSTYGYTFSYTLDSTYYNQDPALTGFFEAIGRDGTNVVLPWMNSNSIQALSGSTNIVRVGNTSSAASGPVFAQVLNSTSPGTGYTPAAAPVQLFANVPANGERLITTAILTAAVGDFGRGDVQISIEAPSNTITVRRFATLANGDVTELTPGTVASDQNQVNVP